MNKNIKVEKVDNTIVVSVMNFTRRTFIGIADYDTVNKKGSIYTNTVNKDIKSLKTWKAKVEECLGESISWEVILK